MNSGIPFVCIWPSIVREISPYNECCLLSYTLNREHFCKGRILDQSESRVVFEAMDLFLNDTITIDVITDEEFEIIKKVYEGYGWSSLQTKEDLVKNDINSLGY